MFGKENIKVKLKEAFINRDGKCSASGVIGFALCVVGMISFAVTTYGYYTEIPNTIEAMKQIIILVGFGALLLGVRSHSDKKYK